MAGVGDAMAFEPWPCCASRTGEGRRSEAVACPFAVRILGRPPRDLFVLRRPLWRSTSSRPEPVPGCAIGHVSAGGITAGRTGTSGSPRRTETDRPDHAGRGDHREFPDPVAGAACPSRSRPARTADSGSRSSGNNESGAITRAAARSTEFPVGSRRPDGIVAGPDGNLWFTRVRRQPASAAFDARPAPSTHFDVCSSARASPATSRSGPTAGSGSREGAGNNDRRDHRPRGEHPTSIQRFPMPAASDPSGITVDGRRAVVHRVRRRTRSAGISPTGEITEFPVGSGEPSGIATGSDGALWFTETAPNKIGRITPSGVLTNEFAVPTPAASPAAIAAGPDGALWFTEFVGNKIGRIARRRRRSSRRLRRRPRAAVTSRRRRSARCRSCGPDGEEGQEQAQEGRLQVQDSRQGKGPLHQAEGRPDHDQARDGQVQAQEGQAPVTHALVMLAGAHLRARASCCVLRRDGARAVTARAPAAFAGRGRGTHRPDAAARPSSTSQTVPSWRRAVTHAPEAAAHEPPASRSRRGTGPVGLRPGRHTGVTRHTVGSRNANDTGPSAR